MIRLAVILTSVLLVVQAKSRCFERLGCFCNDPPFGHVPERIFSRLPQSPEQVGTTFLLNTRENIPNDTEPLLDDVLTATRISIERSHLNKSLPTKVIVHGFRQNGYVEWMRKMTTALLKQGNYNVIRVNWQLGALGFYSHSSADTRIVGAEISLLMDEIRDTFPNTTVADPWTWHIIGHSLGAHAAGYAGERQNGLLGRITGLDPAGPEFEDTDIRVRLDPTDAIFVDVIHTDTNGYGISQPVGHLDFYVNGGKDQPGCYQLQRLGKFTLNILSFVSNEAKKYVGCSHMRSHEYFTESINCSFLARLANSSNYDDYYKPALYFDNAQLAVMGFYAYYFTPLEGVTHVMFMGSTLSEAPYCAYQYRVKIFFDNPNNSSDDVHGDIFLSLVGTKNQTEKTLVESGQYTPGAVANLRLNVDVDVGPLIQVDFYWQQQFARSCEYGIFVSRIEVQSMKTNEEYLFCGPQDKIQSNKGVFLPANSCDSQY